jgi:fatty-acyl-CoA synthase
MGDADDRPTIATFLVERAGDDHEGLRFEGRSWTWNEVVGECAARAAWLTAERGDGPFHVGVLLDNVPEYVFLLGGAALVGATVVGINPSRRGAELARDIRHTDCQLIVTEDVHLGLLDDLDLGVDADRIHVVGAPAYQEAISLRTGAPLPREVPAPDTLWVLIFTSGSTGAPKAVRATQGRLARYGGLGFTPEDVLYGAMPLFHGNALSACLVPAMASGATLVLKRRFSASAVLDDLREHEVTYFNTVGRAISYVLTTPPTDRDREHRVKFVLAPETSAVDAVAFRDRFGIPVIEGYGSSEGVIRMVPVGGARPGALGRPDSDADVTVVDPETAVECAVAAFDDAGRLCNPTEAIGEIVRRDGGARFEGYYANNEANAARTRNGWYWSGDLGYRDADGVFYFAGRDVDWIRVDGENFAAAPIERILERHPSIAGAAVVGVPDPVTGDQVLGVVELVDGGAFDPDEFAAFLAEQRDLGTKWAPRFVRIVDRLPVTGVDKIDRKPLRVQAWSTGDPVWWRPDPRSSGYVILTGAARAIWEQSFADNGRSHLLPS